MQPLAKHKQVGDYILLSHLGEGTSGEVWKADKGGRTYAIKFFHARSGNEARREFEAMQKIAHPNIIDEYEISTWGDREYMVMDYLEGKPMGEARSTDYSPEDIEKMAIALASALQHAHEHNIIHRDLKPANVFIGPDKTIKVLDFGASDSISYDPHEKLVKGSYSYMSPEQLAGKANFQNDIWSYGVTLYQVLTGVHPYSSTTIEQLAEKMLLLEVDFPHHVNPSISPNLSYVIMKCLRKKIRERYRNFQEVIDDLQGDQIGEMEEKFGGKRQILERLESAEKFAEKSLKMSKNVTTAEGVATFTTILSLLGGIGASFIGIVSLIGRGLKLLQGLGKQPKISIEKDLLKVGLLTDQARFNQFIQTIDKYKETNARGQTDREYLLSWHWKNDRGDEAVAVAEQLLVEDPRNVSALSFFTSRNYQSGQLAEAELFCKQLMALNPSDSSSFFFEKVLLRDNKSRISTTDEAFLAETVLQALSAERPQAGTTSNPLRREILRFGYVKIPVRVIQHNFDYLSIKAKAEETANNKQIPKTRVAIQAELVLYPDHMEISPLEEESEQVPYVTSPGFRLPLTGSYQSIERIALGGRAIQFEEQGWLTFQFDEPELADQLSALLLESNQTLQGVDPSIDRILTTLTKEKKKEKIRSIVKLVLLTLFIGQLGVFLYKDYADPEDLTFMVFFFNVVAVFIILVAAPRLLLPMVLFKKAKIWLYNSRFNARHFPAFYRILLRSSILTPQEPGKQLPTRLVAKPFIIDTDWQELTIGQETFPFADLSAIQVSDQKITFLINGIDTYSFRFRHTDYAQYLPVLSFFFRDRMELI